MKTVLFLALFAAPSAFGAKIFFRHDIGETSVETKFDLYGGGTGTLKESQSGYATAASLGVFQDTGYRMADPDGTDSGDDYAVLNYAHMDGSFSGGGLFVEGEVDSEQWGDGAGYPWDYKPLVTDTHVFSAVSLYWDFFVTGGDVAIMANVSPDDPTGLTQYVRLSGNKGLIFDINSDSPSHPNGPYSTLPEPLTLTPGRYLLQAFIGEINGDDDHENRFRITMSGVDKISHHHVPDSGTSLVLFSGPLLGLAALRHRRARWTSRRR